jgi:Putative prokaryotic signal transducing protein
MSTNWVLICSSNNSNKIEIIRAVLNDNGIKAVIINKMDSMQKQLMNAEIELLVSPDDVINAKFIISKNKL